MTDLERFIYALKGMGCQHNIPDDHRDDHRVVGYEADCLGLPQGTQIKVVRVCMTPFYFKADGSYVANYDEDTGDYYMRIQGEKT